MNSENIIWECTPSQLVNIKCYILCGLFFWTIIPLFFFFWKYLKVRNMRFRLTSERLIITKGVFNKETSQIELYRVKDIHLEEPFIYRIFRLGNILLYTSDKELPVTVLPAIKHPITFKEKIRQVVEKLRVERNVREVDFR